MDTLGSGAEPVPSTSIDSSSAVTRTTSRRRRRSERLALAVVLLALAAVAVVASLATGSAALTGGAGVIGVLLGVGACRATYAEVVETRRAAATDRARLAKDYRALATEQVASNRVFIEFVERRAATQAEVAAKQANSINALETRLAEATADVFEAREQLGREREEAERNDRRLADSEERAAQAIVRVAELEQEMQVLLDQVRLAQHPGVGRRRA